MFSGTKNDKKNFSVKNGQKLGKIQQKMGKTEQNKQN
jgi:hypothetical protein